MKPRVLLCTDVYRIVRSGYHGGCYSLEVFDGRDAMHVKKWKHFDITNTAHSPESHLLSIVGEIGRALVRRERIARERRRKA